MTYNIQHGKKLEGNGLTAFLDFFSEESPVIIGLNEVDSRMLRSGFSKQYQYLADRLKMNYSFGPALSHGFGYYGNAFLTVYPILETENYLLPKGQGLEQRALLESVLQIPGLGEVLVMVTHLSLDQSQRKIELSWLKEHIRKKERPFLLLGDMNCELDQFVGYSSLNQNRATFPVDLPFLRIDHIINGINNSSLIEENIYELKRPELSDHLPFTAEILLD